MQSLMNARGVSNLFSGCLASARVIAASILAGSSSAGSARRLRHGLRDDRLSRWAGERRLAGKQLEQHTTQGIDVATSVNGSFAADLFRTHVRGRPNG